MGTGIRHKLEYMTPVRHWDVRVGICLLRGFPPSVKAETLFRQRYGFWPPVVVRGADGVAVGPWIDDYSDGGN